MKAPLAEVKERFGSKEKLADEVFKLLGKGDEESKEDFKARVQTMSNRTLLHLYEMEEKIRELGGREKVADAILAAHKRPKDGNWRNKLVALGSGELLDRYGAAKKLEKRGGRVRGQAQPALERARRKRRRQKLHAVRARRAARKSAQNA